MVAAGVCSNNCRGTRFASPCVALAQSKLHIDLHQRHDGDDVRVRHELIHVCMMYVCCMYVCVSSSWVKKGVFLTLECHFGLNSLKL
eukprot:COSAG01_NODE_1499_length_10112_cov_22.543394_2_plen_87_part_00